jgi:hypothetical protein
MTTPKFRMLSSTDPADASCTAWFTVNGKEHQMRFAENTQAFMLADVIQDAYNCGIKDGARNVASRLYRELEGHL